MLLKRVLWWGVLCLAIGYTLAGSPGKQGQTGSEDAQSRLVSIGLWGGKEQTFDCSQIHARGIDRQTNLRAARIKRACGATGGGSASKLDVASAIVEKLVAPFTLGGQDRTVNNYAADVYPKVTQSESAVWGNGSTIVVNYNSSHSDVNCAAGTSYSTDGGATFTEIRPNPLCVGHGTNGGDPVLVYNAKLSLWFAGDLAAQGDCGAYGIGLWTSPDGVHFSTGACAHVGSDDDRESAWVDNNPVSPFYGRQYISFNNYATTNTNLQVVHSDNGVTWSAPVDLFSSGFLRNVQITGGPDGSVFVASMDEGGGATNNRTNYVFRSTDGGATWSYPIQVGPPFAPVGDKQCDAYFRAVSPIWRHMGWGQPAAGPGGVVHYVYAGAGTQVGDAGDIYYVRSTDNGSTWSDPRRLNTDPSNRAQWMPSLSVTQDGALVAGWYDRRHTNNFNYEYYGRTSTDGGVTWQADAPVSDVIMPQPIQPDEMLEDCYAGDYNYHTANGNTAYLTWTDGRNLLPDGTSHQDVGFDKITLMPGSSATPAPPSPTPTACSAQFNDVPAGAPFYAYVRCLVCRGIVTGYGCGGPGEPCPGAYFRPNAGSTRAQLSKITANAAGFNEPVPTARQTYADVPLEAPLWVFVERLSARGIISGYSCGRPTETCDDQSRPYFRPNSPVTRGQASKIISEAAQIVDPQANTQQAYADVPYGSPFWVYIERLSTRGIVGGYQCGSSPSELCDSANRPYFRPGSAVSRGQAAKLVANTFLPCCDTP